MKHHRKSSPGARGVPTHQGERGQFMGHGNTKGGLQSEGERGEFVTPNSSGNAGAGVVQGNIGEFKKGAERAKTGRV